jgi:hypothetical protein
MAPNAADLGFAGYPGWQGCPLSVIGTPAGFFRDQVYFIQEFIKA